MLCALQKRATSILNIPQTHGTAKNEINISASHNHVFMVRNFSEPFNKFQNQLVMLGQEKMRLGWCWTDSVTMATSLSEMGIWNKNENTNWCSRRLQMTHNTLMENPLISNMLSNITWKAEKQYGQIKYRRRAIRSGCATLRTPTIKGEKDCDKNIV